MKLSPILRALEFAWSEIQRSVPGVPDVSIMVSDIDAWGQAEPGQVVIATNTLRVGTAFTFDTLLHEAVHQHLIARGEKRRVWKGHGHKFQAVAAHFGLVTFGQSKTVMLSPETMRAYRKPINRLASALEGFAYYDAS